MCGISGYWSRKSFSSSFEQQFSHATQEMFHRGPDALSTWFSTQKNLALGHTRLSIIDLHTGHQPLKSQNQKITAVVNGEFYDYEKIRQELILDGFHFNTQSDSEILIPLYQKYGEKCLDHLRGEFAFILWDEDRQRLFFARDRFGIKPLFYSFYQGALYIASEIKSLLTMGVPARWNHRSMMNMESTLYRQDNTCFEGVEALTPGYYAIATPEKIQIHRYWDFFYPKKNPEMTSPQEIIQEFKKIFFEAVSLRMRADVPIACYLSGGLDSCSVLGAMSELKKAPIDAFTLSFDHGDYDEREIAREMSAFCGANFHPIPIKSSDIAENFTHAIRHAETLIFNNHVVAKFLLSRFVRDHHYKVVLTGEGSDEILAGYPPFRVDMMNHHMNLHSPSEREELLQRLKDTNKVSQGLFVTNETIASNPQQQRIIDYLGYLPSMLELSSIRMDMFKDLSRPEYLQKKEQYFPLTEMMADLPLEQLKNVSRLNQSLYLWSKSLLPGYILTVLGDRMEMAHSIEGRVPFLDHRLVEFMTQVPLELKIKGMTEKYLLREALKDFITPTIYARQKHPFLAPTASEKINDPMNQLMKEFFHGKELKESPFYIQTEVLKLWKRVQSDTPEQRRIYDGLFMQILSSCVLQQQFHLS